MNRDDIVAKMALREKEIFEKYKDTFPFPAREFAEEMGLKIVRKTNSPPMVAEKNGKIYLIIPIKPPSFAKSDMTKNQLERFAISMALVHYFLGYGDSVLVEAINFPEKRAIISCALLMSEEIIKSLKQDRLSNKAITEYFDVPVDILKNYMDYLEIK